MTATRLFNDIVCSRLALRGDTSCMIFSELLAYGEQQSTILHLHFQCVSPSSLLMMCWYCAAGLPALAKDDNATWYY
jgi:hypothetical protein